MQLTVQRQADVKQQSAERRRRQGLALVPGVAGVLLGTQSSLGEEPRFRWLLEEPRPRVPWLEAPVPR